MSTSKTKQPAKKRSHPAMPRIDKTTLYDTITMEQWHKFREAERLRVDEEDRLKAEEAAAG